ncbi:MAG: DUF2203 domain-containing protein [Candidatus Pacebacteria bacterium]|nr:DUF2203 domain-containing protein [Candidatus Paceibacterota bacterium]
MLLVKVFLSRYYSRILILQVAHTSKRCYYMCRNLEVTKSSGPSNKFRVQTTSRNPCGPSGMQGFTFIKWNDKNYKGLLIQGRISVMSEALSTKTRAPRPGRKYFDVAEENRSLPYISRIVADLMRYYQRVVEVRRRIENLNPYESSEQLEAKYETAMTELGDLVDELHQTGVELADFEKGLVNFPAIFKGKEIYLCWQYGEETVMAWHEIKAGFSGRQDISLLG